MDATSLAEKALVESQLKRIVTRLFKSFLVMLEDIRQNELLAISKNQQLPKEFLEQFNYLDFPTYSKLRKKVLDESNDAQREMALLLNNFDIKLLSIQPQNHE